MQSELLLLASLAVSVLGQNDSFVRSALSDADIAAMMRMDVPEQIRYFGYPTETHTVVTDDGYTLTMDRVPNGKGQQFDNRRPIILLQHGCFCYSGEFFLTGPGHALGYIFADAGFDVWVLNSRGTKYSRRHVSLDPNKHKAYYSFSFHEIALYDLTKAMDYVLGFRKARRLVHVGFSEGSTAYYVLMSEKPEYNEKVSVHYSLGPVAYSKHMKCWLYRSFAAFYDILERVAESTNFNELTRKSEFFDNIFRLCQTNHYLCKILMFTITGFDHKFFDDRLLPLILTNFPMSTSLQQIQHHAQLINSGKFRRFDFGRARNLQLYNSSNPPDYDLSRISGRVRLVYSCNDYLSSCVDVEHLYRQLPNAKKIKMKWAEWSHSDYIWGSATKSYLADTILDDLKRYIKI